jgi:hypothetical protein
MSPTTDTQRERITELRRTAMSRHERDKIINAALHAHLGHWAIAVHQATYPEQRVYAEQRHKEILSVLRQREAR